MLLFISLLDAWNDSRFPLQYIGLQTSSGVCNILIEQGFDPVSRPECAVADRRIFAKDVLPRLGRFDIFEADNTTCLEVLCRLKALAQAPRPNDQPLMEFHAEVWPR